MDDAAEANLTTFLVEHYWPGVTRAEFERAAVLVREAADVLAQQRKSIRYLHSTLVPEDELGFSALAADSPALVEEAYRHAGVRFDRIVESLEVAGVSAVPVKAEREEEEE